MNYRNIVTVDIDGCLTDYPRVFLSWLAECKGLLFGSLESLKASMTRQDYEGLKHAYRISGVKRHLPVFAGAKETLEALKRFGLDIWIVTSRPRWEPVFTDTTYWLKESGLPYDKLAFVCNKRDFIRKRLPEGISIVIDDTYELVQFASNDLDIVGIYLNKERPDVTDKKVVAVKDWKEVQHYLSFRLSLQFDDPS